MFKGNFTNSSSIIYSEEPECTSVSYERMVLGIKHNYLGDSLVGSKIKLLNAVNVVRFQVFSAAKILFVRHNLFKT